MASWRKSKEFKCIMCSKDFDKVSQYKKHLKDKHNTELEWNSDMNRYQVIISGNQNENTGITK